MSTQRQFQLRYIVTGRFTPGVLPHVTLRRRSRLAWSGVSAATCAPLFWGSFVKYILFVCAQLIEIYVHLSNIRLFIWVWDCFQQSRHAENLQRPSYCLSELLVVIILLLSCWFAGACQTLCGPSILHRLPHKPHGLWFLRNPGLSFRNRPFLPAS